MKKLIISSMALLVLFGIYAFRPAHQEVVATEDGIKWYTIEEAMTAAKKKKKKVFVDVYTDWCGWCKRMDATTFQDPQVVKYLNENFYPVKFNAEQKADIKFKEKNYKFVEQGRRGYHELAAEMLDNRLGYPSFVMLDESFERIVFSPGYKQPDQLMKELKYAAENIYKKTDWNTYKNTR